MINLWQGDCLDLMKNIPDKSVDMILCDLPYGITNCKWDNAIPFEPLWEQYNRIIKDNGAIVLFGSEPFASRLRLSNLKMYRYDWIWEKTVASNFVMCNKQPQRKHENILVFYKKQPTYNPQMQAGKPYKDVRKNDRRRSVFVDDGASLGKTPIHNTGTRYPSTIQKFSNKNNKRLHSTQKPVALLEYLIKTYTNRGETVLDNCMGSGSTGVACVNTKRSFIGIELDKHYFKVADKRITNQIQSNI